MNNRLTLVRKTLGFSSQKAFAQVLDMPWRTIQVYEQAVSYMPATFFVKLKEHFNVSIDWLLSGKGEMFLKPQTSFFNFENNDLILKSLADNEIENALVTAYIEKTIYPLFQAIGAEKSFWQELLKGHRDRISAVFYLLRALQDLKTNTITLENAREVLMNLINQHMVTLMQQCEFMYLSKDNLIETIEKLDDLGCFIILTNSKKITEALSPLLNQAHINYLAKKESK